MTQNLSVGSFNILSDGLSNGEFLCEGGDKQSCDWRVRRERIAAVIVSMLETCDVVVTQENDHFFCLIDLINTTMDIHICGVLALNSNKISTSRKQKLVHQCKEITSGTSQDLPDGHDALYEFCNLHLHEGSIFSHSYAEESKEYCDMLSQLYGNTTDDLYRCDDGIGIYYRSDRVKLTDVGLPDNIECNIIRHKDVIVINNADCAVRVNFQLIGMNTQYFTLYGAHLKSGEDITKEQIRCKQLQIILEDAKLMPNPIIAMDSNNSYLYEKSYPTSGTDNNNTASADKFMNWSRLSEVICYYGYVDAVGLPYQSTGNECFKMRHGQGGQPSKHFQFMFDAIDKILVPSTMTINTIPYRRDKFGFQRYDPDLQKELLALRSDPERRKLLLEDCRNSERIRSTTCAIEAFGVDHILAGLYPNPRSPSDHPPVYCQIQLS